MAYVPGAFFLPPHALSAFPGVLDVSLGRRVDPPDTSSRVFPPFLLPRLSRRQNAARVQRLEETKTGHDGQGLREPEQGQGDGGSGFWGHRAPCGSRQRAHA